MDSPRQSVSPVAPSAFHWRSFPSTGLVLNDMFEGQPVESFAPAQAIFWEGDAASNIFDVQEGVLRICRILPDGRRAIVGFIYPGDVMGVSFEARYLFSAEAVTKVKIRRIPRNSFFAQVDDMPELRQQLFAVLCDEMSAALDQMLLLGRKSAEERVVSFLLSVHRKSGIENTIELPMTRLDIADYLGLTIETVSRMMTSLMRRCLISASDKHTLTLRKMSDLRQIAGWDETEEQMESVRRAVWPH